ncbi:MAG: hypothetical protein U0103_10930 [Candidatus Obscuribacterales bacterium]
MKTVAKALLRQNGELICLSAVEMKKKIAPIVTARSHKRKANRALVTLNMV